MTARISYKLSYRQQAKVQLPTLLSSKGQYLRLIYFQSLPKMGCQKCRNMHNNNSNSDNPLTSRRTDGGKNVNQVIKLKNSVPFGKMDKCAPNIPKNEPGRKLGKSEKKTSDSASIITQLYSNNLKNIRALILTLHASNNLSTVESPP